MRLPIFQLELERSTRVQCRTARANDFAEHLRDFVDHGPRVRSCRGKGKRQSSCGEWPFQCLTSLTRHWAKRTEGEPNPDCTSVSGSRDTAIVWLWKQASTCRCWAILLDTASSGEALLHDTLQRHANGERRILFLGLHSVVLSSSGEGRGFELATDIGNGKTNHEVLRRGQGLSHGPDLVDHHVEGMRDLFVTPE